MAYFLGIDGGTESLRAFVFDLEGRPGSHRQPPTRRFPSRAGPSRTRKTGGRPPGASVTGAVAAAGDRRRESWRLRADTTCCSVVALDREGAPLRPAMIWMDVRSAEESDRVAATGDPFLRVNGDGSGPVSAEWMIPKSLWLKTHQPDLFEPRGADRGVSGLSQFSPDRAMGGGAEQHGGALALPERSRRPAVFAAGVTGA